MKKSIGSFFDRLGDALLEEMSRRLLNNINAALSGQNQGLLQSSGVGRGRRAPAHGVRVTRDIEYFPPTKQKRRKRVKKNG